MRTTVGERYFLHKDHVYFMRILLYFFIPIGMKARTIVFLILFCN